jgi:hypothetical protein
MPTHPNPRPHHPVPTEPDEAHEPGSLPVEPDDGTPLPVVPRPEDEGHEPDVPA